MNIDYFIGIVVIYLYQPFEQLAELTDYLQQRCSAINVVVQHRYQQPLQIDSLNEQLQTTVTELGCEYHIDCQRQNPGLFLDMRQVRQWLMDNSKDKRILNLFSFSCALSVAALKGNAYEVINVDMAKGILKQGERNHQLNQLSNARFWPHNIFNSFGKFKKHGPFDLIIIDPPAFQRGSINLVQDYKKLLSRIALWSHENTELVLTLNDPNLPTSWFMAQIEAHLPQFAIKQRFDLPAVFADADPQKALRVWHLIAQNALPN